LIFLKLANHWLANWIGFQIIGNRASELRIRQVKLAVQTKISIGKTFLPHCFGKFFQNLLPIRRPIGPVLLELDDVKTEQPVPHRQKTVDGFARLSFEVVVEGTKGGLEGCEVYHSKVDLGGKNSVVQSCFLPN
jgi:hypothetical protein